MAKRVNTFNDRMVAKTVLPTIYLWLLAAGAIVGMGILKPEVVLTNLDGFIALLAIISGVALPALNTVMRMWESEQAQEVENIPTGLKHNRERDAAEKEHLIEVAKIEQSHSNEMKASAQKHTQEMDKMRSETTPKGKKE
tara:strand:+ start:1139 stop:1558 length:420 start_codon:yes stop_codon:yes gene_type:complete